MIVCIEFRDRANKRSDLYDRACHATAGRLPQDYPSQGAGTEDLVLRRPRVLATQLPKRLALEPKCLVTLDARPAIVRRPSGLPGEGPMSRPNPRISLGRLAKEFVARCLLWSGVIYVLRLVLWRNRVLIVVYHDPQPDALDAHLAYLCRIADPIKLSDFRRSPISRRPRVIITIDDGHAGNARLLDIFRAHGIRPTIFICSGIVATRRQYWWRHSSAVTPHIEQFKRLPNAERLAALSTFGFAQDTELDTPAALSKSDIDHMRGAVDFQSHGRFHPILPCCNDDDCGVEIVQSRHEIERLAGGECRSFAFPNGNYGAREIKVLKSAGYESARTLDAGWNDATTDPFRLKAVPVSDDASWAWFAVQTSLIPAYFRYLKRGSFFGRAPQPRSHISPDLRVRSAL